MKKIIYSFALMGFFALAAPKIANADVPQDTNCHSVQFYCGDEPAGVVVICDEVPESVWVELLC